MKLQLYLVDIATKQMGNSESHSGDVNISRLSSNQRGDPATQLRIRGQQVTGQRQHFNDLEFKLVQYTYLNVLQWITNLNWFSIPIWNVLQWITNLNWSSLPICMSLNGSLI